MDDIDKVLSDINSDIASNLDNLLKRAVEFTNKTLKDEAADPVTISYNYPCNRLMVNSCIRAL